MKSCYYLFVSFTGSEQKFEDEQIYFAVSHDGKTWCDLNHEKPVLISSVGERGVRDPYILRNRNGEGTILIATDLSIYTRPDGWDTATTAGSLSIVIWRSKNLIEWGQPELVDVASAIPTAGCVWAPEAIYDEQRDQYIVFWASSVEKDYTGERRMNMYYSLTKDFHKFSVPEEWMAEKMPTLDSTVIQVGDYYYRATAAEGSIRLDRSLDLYEGWEKVSKIHQIFQNPRYDGRHLEGPELFQYNENDWLKDERGEAIPTYGLFCDQFAEGKGYLAFQTTDIKDITGEKWSVVDNVDFGTLKKRHGAIISITREEYRRLIDHFS